MRGQGTEKYVPDLELHMLERHWSNLNLNLNLFHDHQAMTVRVRGQGTEKYVPDLELHMLECSHWVQQERWEDTNALMRAWLAKKPVAEPAQVGVQVSA